MANQGFAGLRVLTLESRRAQEMAKLITNSGGAPVVAPSMREVPLESNTEALQFASALLDGRLDVVIFLTGVGTRALTRVVETVYPLEQFVAAMRKIAVVTRGPKPAAALRELGIPITLAAPEPNTSCRPSIPPNCSIPRDTGLRCRNTVFPIRSFSQAWPSVAPR